MVSVDLYSRPTISSNYNSVVRVIAGPSSGTGNFLTDDTVLTASHVVSEFKSEGILVQHDGMWYEAEIILDIPSPTDIAVLKLKRQLIEGEYSHNRPIATIVLDCKDPSPADEVYAIGFPHNYDMMMRWGHVVEPTFIRRLGPFVSEVLFPPNQQHQQEMKMFTTVDLLLMRGNSGGMVFNSSGRAIGMSSLVAAEDLGSGNVMYYNISYIIKSSVLCGVFDANGIYYTAVNHK